MDKSELLKKVRKIEIKAKGLSQNIFAGEYHSAFKGRGMTFSEVREYQYGDDVRDIVNKIYIDEKIERYIVDIVFATRFPSDYGLNELKSIISFGASPRASISMALAARAYAFLRGRGYVIPEDVRAVCHDVMRHRIGLSYEAEANNISADEIISQILDKVAVP